MKFLSGDWFSTAHEAVRSASPPPSGQFQITQRVDDIAWLITIGEDSSIVRIPNDGATPGAVDAGRSVAFSQTHATAVAIARGETNAHTEFLLGNIDFSGSVEDLISHRDHLRWLEQALAGVNQSTTWD